MGGFGVMDFMVKSSRENRALLKDGKKSLRKIYQENNLYYIKRRVAEKTKDYDEDQKRLFMERFYARQKKVRKKNTVIFIFTFVILAGIVTTLFWNL